MSAPAENAENVSFVGVYSRDDDHKQRTLLAEFTNDNSSADSHIVLANRLQALMSTFLCNIT